MGVNNDTIENDSLIKRSIFICNYELDDEKSKNYRY